MCTSILRYFCQYLIVYWAKNWFAHNFPFPGGSLFCSVLQSIQARKPSFRQCVVNFPKFMIVKCPIFLCWWILLFVTHVILSSGNFEGWEDCWSGELSFLLQPICDKLIHASVCFSPCFWNDLRWLSAGGSRQGEAGEVDRLTEESARGCRTS